MRQFTNNASASISGNITNVATSITLATGTGALFPALSGAGYFMATLVGYDGEGIENAWEIVKVTGRSTDVLTVERGQEGTSNVAWDTGTTIELRITAAAAAAFSAGGLVLDSVVKTSGFNAVAGQRYLIDTSSGAFTSTFPASPAVGDRVGITDVAGTLSLNALGIGRNGNNVFGAAEDGSINVSRWSGILMYVSASQGWVPV